MTTAVPGLIKIGKTGTANYEQRMYDPEHDGYRNVTALKCSFAIVTQLLSSFDGVVIFPKTETKAEVITLKANCFRTVHIHLNVKRNLIIRL